MSLQAPSNPADEVSDRARWIADQIQREDGLVNTRLTWMLNFEGLLFAALALAGSTEADKKVAGVLLLILPWAGMGIGLLCWFGVEAALRQIRFLKEQWRDNFGDSRETQNDAWKTKSEGQPVPPFGGPWPHFLGASYSRFLPWLVIVSWLLVRVMLGGEDRGRSMPNPSEGPRDPPSESNGPYERNARP